MGTTSSFASPAAHASTCSPRLVSQALANQTNCVTIEHPGTDPKILFIGIDDRGMELEIVAVVLPGQLLVIHAMPTHYRRERP